MTDMDAIKRAFVTQEAINLLGAGPIHDLGCCCYPHISPLAAGVRVPAEPEAPHRHKCQDCGGSIPASWLEHIEEIEAFLTSQPLPAPEPLWVPANHHPRCASPKADHGCRDENGAWLASQPVPTPEPPAQPPSGDAPDLREALGIVVGLALDGQGMADKQTYLEVIEKEARAALAASAPPLDVCPRCGRFSSHDHAVASGDAPDLGMYPASSPDGPRTPWQEGWNAAMLAMGDAPDLREALTGAIAKYADDLCASGGSTRTAVIRTIARAALAASAPPSLWGPDGPTVGQVVTIAGTTQQVRWTGHNWEPV